MRIRCDEHSGCRLSMSSYRQTLDSICAGGAPAKPEPFRSIKQVLDGGGVPPCSAARRALAHVFELGGNLLQGAIRRCRLDAGDQPDQPVIALLARRAVQQCRLYDALGHQSSHGAAQPFHRPSGPNFCASLLAVGCAA